MRIVFMGSSDFGITALERISQKHQIAAIVSTPAKAKGRGLKQVDSPVTSYCLTHGFKPVLTPDDLKDETFRNELIQLQADIFVVVAFRILPKAVFSIPPLGTVNIHASLLPKFRGPAPIQRAIEAGEKETGVTIFRIDEGIDTGEVILQKRIPIGDTETTPELYERLSINGAEALMESLDMLEKHEYKALPQKDKESSKAPKLRKEEAHLNWNDSSELVFNKIRAFKPFPGTYAIVNGKRLGIEWAEPAFGNGNFVPGTVISTSNEYFEVKCGQGALRVLEVKPEGRKRMAVHDYFLGNRIPEGTVLQ